MPKIGTIGQHQDADGKPVSTAPKRSAGVSPSTSEAMPPHGLDLLQFIGNHFDSFQKIGASWMALCPAHDDNKPSLSIGVGDGGRILLKCHAGCETKDVLQHVDLCEADLFPGNPRTVATYDYRDEQGQLLYQVVRREPKDFRQRRPDGTDNWVWNTTHVRRVLYRLPELLNADPKSRVFIVEGEKDADLLAGLDFVATTNSGGAGKWKPEYGEALRGRAVVIIPDNDDPGRKHAKQVAAALESVAKSVQILELPGLPDKGDVSDWWEAGGTRDTLEIKATMAPHYEPAESIPSIPVIKIITSASAAPTEGKPSIPAIKIIPPTLGEAAYHGLIGEFLRSVAPYTEATDAAILAHLLPALGTIIGPGVYTHGTKQPPRVNTVLVGPTSTGRKGTSLAPVDELMRLVDPSFWKEQRVGGLSTGEGLIEKVADKKTWNEENKEYDITTVEKRLYVVEEEFSKILAQIRREGNVLSQVLRESFDSGNLAVLTRNNPIQADGAHICITGHITPEELFDRFNHIEMANGFGNRFVWFVVKSDKVIARCVPIPEAVYQKFAPSIRRLRNSTLGLVNLATPAMETWEKEIYPYLREDRQGFAGSLLARGSSFVLRTALIYSLLDPPSEGGSQGIAPTSSLIAKLAAALPPSKGGSQEIAPVHLDAAMAVWTYCEESVQRLFKTRSGTLLGDKVLALLSAGPMTKDKLNDHLSPKQKDAIDGVLADLEKAGSVVKTKEKKAGAGRPATVWALAGDTGAG